jgi:hypothetical protein
MLRQLLAQVGDQVDAHGAGGQGGRHQRGGQPPQGLVAKRLAQWNTGRSTGPGREGGRVVGWSLKVVGSPGRQGGVGQHTEGDEQGGEHDEGVAPPMGLDQPAS